MSRSIKPTRLTPFRRYGHLTAALLLAASSFASIPACADETPPRTIRASGESTVRVAPDRARISISVVSRAATAREASEANATTSKSVLEKLRAAVKAAGEVRTAGYDLAAEYDYGQPRGAGRGPVLVGYVATNRFAIVSGDLAGVGGLVDAAVAAGAKQIDSIGFFLDDEAPPRRQALLHAGRKARAEAETIAESLGLVLGDVLDASSVGSVRPPVPVFGRDRAMMAMDSPAPPTEIVPGSLEIAGSVTVTFAIR